MKNITKRMLAMVFALAILLTVAVPAAAVQTQEQTEIQTVQPRLIGITGLAAQLSISKTGRATCGAIVYNDGDYDVAIIISLKQDDTTIKTWSMVAEVGNNQFEKYYYVASGHEYQVTATAQVSSGGSLVRTYKISSNVVSY